jgi:hypothetical protein
MHTPATAEQLTPDIFNVFQRWIDQRPGLDPANYDRSGYRSDSRKIQQDGTRARAALRLATAYPFSAAALLDSCRSDFSGRLSLVFESGKGASINYCTGQYWPTEYRIAAAVVLERYAEEVRPKQTPGGRIPASIHELKEMNRAAGGHFFDRAAMKSFRSRILPRVYTGPGGVYFVSSEQHEGGPRQFTVRRFDPQTASVDSFGEFGKWSEAGAKSAAREAAAMPEPPCHVCGGTGRGKYNADENCWHCNGTSKEPQTQAA